MGLVCAEQRAKPQVNKQFPGHSRERQKNASSSKIPGMAESPRDVDPVGKKEVMPRGEKRGHSHGGGPETDGREGCEAGDFFRTPDISCW